MKVKIKKHQQYAATPFKIHDNDFCYDVLAISEEQIAPNVWKYGLGLSFQMDRSELELDDDTSISIDLRSRSSIWKTGMVLSNGTGTIDESYMGEVSAVFYHVMPDMPRYVVGDRIGQIKLGVSIPLEFEEVQELIESGRGLNGYGSTGR